MGEGKTIMRNAILIDPKDKTLKSILLADIENSFDHAYKLMNCQMITIVRIDSERILLLDEEAEMRKGDLYAWKYIGIGHPMFFNKALIVGYREGKDLYTDLDISPQAIRRLEQKILFLGGCIR